MNVFKTTITFLACCCTILAVTPSASADFVGVTTVNKDDPDTEFLCTQGHGDNVPTPLTVCSVLAVFDDPNDVLRATGNADLQVHNGENPDVFYQHPLNTAVIAPSCFFVSLFPDLICDTYITIGVECGAYPVDGTHSDNDFDADEFDVNGHIVGGWFNASPANGQGDAGQDPPNQNLQVLFLQSSVAQGLSLTGDIDIFWSLFMDGDIVAEIDVPVECAAVDQDPCESVNGRVTLCHIPPGNPDNAHTITLSVNALPAHLAHGDYCGACEEDDGLLMGGGSNVIPETVSDGPGRLRRYRR